MFKTSTHIISNEAAKRGPEHTPYNYTIDPNIGKTPPWVPYYVLSDKELEVLREWIKEMFKPRKIRVSKSPAATPILFIPKAHGTDLVLCVDYGGISTITTANFYLLLIMSELQDRIRDSIIFTKDDLKNGKHLIRINESNESNAAFHSKYRL
jgi:hypothetical protein